MEEKMPTRKFNGLGFCLSALRVWQWFSSCLVYASFGFLYSYIVQNRLGENTRMKGVQVLGLMALVYSTLVICFVHIFKSMNKPSWRVFAVMSVPGDIIIMAIFLAKITLLSVAGLPASCRGLTREDYQGEDLVRQPINGYSTIRFGPGTRDNIGELDKFCNFPRIVYGLSVVAIFSYTFTILFTVLYLQQQKPNPVDNEKVTAPGHIEETVPHLPQAVDDDYDTPASSIPNTPLRRSPSPSQGSVASLEQLYDNSRSHSVRSSHSSIHDNRSVTSWGATTLASDGESIRSSAYPVATSQQGRRWSTSTSSSYDANQFIVTDGFRPDTQPPAYAIQAPSHNTEPIKAA